MEEIDLKELFDFFKKKIGLLIIITVLVCIGGCIYGLVIQKPMYKSDTTVILGVNDTNNSTSLTQNDVTLNSNLVSTYTEVVKSRRVLNKVIKELELDLSYEQLSSKISVSAVNETEIIRITVTDLDPTMAKNIANATANYFSKEIVKLYNMNNVNILDKAIKAKKPYNINIPKQLVIYIMLGLVMSFGVIFLIYYFDRTIKSVEQVEQKIKLPILGTVQAYTSGGNK